MKTLPQPWTVAMEATVFTGWIYDHLRPHAEQVKVAHPLMLRAIAAAKKKNDQIDASKIADCLRCDFLPECHMASTQIRDRRRTLRYRHLLVRQMVQMKNRISGLLMETGVSYNKQRLHKVGYFRELLSTNEDVRESIRPLLRLSRDTIVRLQKMEPSPLPYANRPGNATFRRHSKATKPNAAPCLKGSLHRRAASASAASWFSSSKNWDDWPMNSPSAVSALTAPIAAPFVLVGRTIEHRGNFRLRNGHGSGMIRFVWYVSPPNGGELRSGNTKLGFVGSVRAGALPTLSCQV